MKVKVMEAMSEKRSSSSRDVQSPPHVDEALSHSSCLVAQIDVFCQEAQRGFPLFKGAVTPA